MKNLTPGSSAVSSGDHFNFGVIDDLRSLEGSPHARLRQREEGEQRGSQHYQDQNHHNPIANANANPIPMHVQSVDPSLDVDASEETYKLQYRKHGLFQQWVNVFVVIDGYSIRKYPDEKRSEKRCKEILLYDAAFSVGIIHARRHA